MIERSYPRLFDEDGGKGDREQEERDKEARWRKGEDERPPTDTAPVGFRELTGHVDPRKETRRPDTLDRHAPADSPIINQHTDRTSRMVEPLRSVMDGDTTSAYDRNHGPDSQSAFSC